jgi:2-polyprenyl-3-methyl-5-hydroxy-6-metoxy-1,4-benzoquinol methylase
MTEQIPKDLRALSQESRDIWNTNAQAWDAHMGEGGGFQRTLIGPATERLLNLQRDELVLDIACGNGAFARRMAALGARVVASDFSAKFIELAQARTTEHVDRIAYHVVDATDEAQLLALGAPRSFDAAVCTMGMMAMPTIEPLLSAAAQLLKPRGRFVFSVMHPCFNNDGMSKFVEEEDRDGELVVTRGVKIVRYKTMRTSKGLGIAMQPQPHFYFCRTLSALLGSCFRAGFVVDAVEEPSYEQPDATRANPALGWSAFSEIPPVLIVRLRL